jgi:hypothetical protein
VLLEFVWKDLPTAHLVCFDAYPYTYLVGAFDTWLLPDEELGLLAVDLLMQKIAAPDQPLPEHALPLAFEKGTRSR